MPINAKKEQKTCYTKKSSNPRARAQLVYSEWTIIECPLLSERATAQFGKHDLLLNVQGLSFSSFLRLTHKNNTIVAFWALIRAMMV